MDVKGKVILFVYAHLDDEAFCSAGTIAKLAQSNSVYVVSLCRGRKSETGTTQHAQRINTFYESNKILGSTPIIFEGHDTQLNIENATRDVEKLIEIYKPEIIFTHTYIDVHRDHVTTFEACIVASRTVAESSITEFYTSENISSTDWSFSTKGSFEPNTYVDVEGYMDIKKTVLGLYKEELREGSDPRSIGSMVTLAKYRGKQVSLNYAESFKSIYRIVK